MAKFTKTLIAAGLMAAAATPAFAADYSGDIHKNDYKWMQFNVMQSVDARIPFNNQNTTYFEMEFGGRSGLFDLYGYVDVFDLLDRTHDDRHNGDNMFIKFAPRMSLDALTGADLSFGPVKELYIATVTNVGDKGLFEHYIGLGSDVEVPWFGKVGFNTYARYVRENYGAENEREWDGYMVSTNWFKPFYTFSNGSFISYQGYLDYKFGADKIADNGFNASNSLEWFNGIYWHSDRYSVGYGLKVFNNMALIRDNESNNPMTDTSGIGHYFAATYKF